MSSGSVGAGAPAAARKPPERAAGGVVASWTRIGVVTLAGLVQAPILFRHVPAADLGVWYLFYAVATFVNLSDLGIPAAFGRAVSYVWGREMAGNGARIPEAYRHASVRSLYASALTSSIVLGTAFAAVCIPLAQLYFGSLERGAVPASTLLPLVVFLAGVVLHLVAAIPATCLSARGDVTWDSVARITAALVGLGLVWFVVPLKGTLLTLSVLYLIQGGVALVVSDRLVASRQGPGWPGEGRPSWLLVRQMTRESVPVFVGRVGAWLTFESTLLIFGILLDPARLPDFVILRHIVCLGGVIANGIPIAIGPRVASAFAAGDAPRVRSLYLATVRYSLVVNTLWTVGVLLWAPEVLALLVGREHFIGYGVLIALAVANFLEVHAASHGHFVFMLGSWPFNPALLAGGAVNLVLASVGGVAFGVTGLAWGSTLSMNMTSHWVQVFHGLKRVGVGFGDFLRTIGVRAAAYAAVLGVAAVAVKAGAGHIVGVGSDVAEMERPARLVFIAAGTLATSALAGVIAWAVAITRDDRAYFLGFLRAAKSK